MAAVLWGVGVSVEEYGGLLLDEDLQVEIILVFGMAKNRSSDFMSYWKAVYEYLKTRHPDTPAPLKNSASTPTPRTMTCECSKLYMNTNVSIGEIMDDDCQTYVEILLCWGEPPKLESQAFQDWNNKVHYWLMLRGFGPDAIARKTTIDNYIVWLAMSSISGNGGR